ncbi:hypothetical protein MOQ_006808, partial [Trypanosoma cruzi marinkellei]
VPPLLHNHERSAQRILAHVLHALQPHADQAGRHALHLLVVLLVVVAAPQRRVAGGVAVLEEVRRSNGAGVRVAALALQRVQHERTQRQLVQRVRLLLLPRRLVFLRCTGRSCRGPLSCCNHSHRETKERVCGCVPRAQRLSSPEEAIVAPSITRQHTPSNARTRQSKNKGERRMTPRAGNTVTHGGHRVAASAGIQRNANDVPQAPIQWHRDSLRRHKRSGLAMSARDASQHPAVAKAFLQCTVQILMCVCMLEEHKTRGTQDKRSTGRHINTARGTAAWQRYMRYGPNLNNHARWQHTPVTKKENKRKEKHGGRVWLCVCVALRVSAHPRRNKTKQEERNMCSTPQALVARPHVTAPSARGASRPLLMRAAGEAHRAVVMSVSVGVRVEQLGGKHTAPLTGRVRQETIKEILEKKRS